MQYLKIEVAKEIHIYVDIFDSKEWYIWNKDFTYMCIYVYTHRYMKIMCVCM